MVDDDRLCPALGLGALARVVDDEGIEVRQRPEDRLRKARLVECQRLARQPLEVAVLAGVDDGVHVLDGAQPRVEREVAVRRHQVRVVIGRLRVDVVAARGLQADDDVAAGEQGQGESDGVDEVERVELGFAPAFVDAPAHRCRQRIEEPAIRVQAQRDRYLAAIGCGVGRSTADPLDQLVPRRGECP